MLSGRYRAGCLTKHFSPAHTGICELCGLKEEDLAHILVLGCPHLLERRNLLVEYSRNILPFSNIFENALEENEQSFVQFLLDLSIRPDVIKNALSDNETLSPLFKITRTWCYSMHRTRLKLLDRWNTINHIITHFTLNN